MSNNLEANIDALRRLNLSVRQQLELAELRLPEINAQVRSLAALGAHDQVTIEGDAILQLPYFPNLGPVDSCQIYQAVLMMPEGVGVAIYDLEDFWERQHRPSDEWTLLGRFQAFDESSSYVKAALLPQVDSLVERLINRLGIQPAN